MAQNRRATRGSALLLAAIMALTSSTPAAFAAAAATPDPTAGAAAVPAEIAARQVSPDTPPGTYDITLVTGDRVRLTVDAHGQYSTSTDEATRVQSEAGPTGVYVYPEEALPAIQSGLVDRELFNVSYLAANGYADSATDRLPVIVTYPRPDAPVRGATAEPKALAERADQLPATTAAVALTSINGVGVAVDKAAAEQFWQQLSGAGSAAAPSPARSLAHGVRKLWLDHRVQATLDESVPLIGAPEAWRAGLDGTGVTVAVLDTGIDATHPDVAGKVVASKSFVPGVSSAADGHGQTVFGGASTGGTIRRRKTTSSRSCCTPRSPSGRTPRSSWMPGRRRRSSSPGRSAPTGRAGAGCGSSGLSGTANC